METQRHYKRRGTPDCPISLNLYRKRPHMPFFPHHHPDVEIIWVKEGSLVYLVEEENLTVNAGEVLILSPGQGHSYVDSSEVSKVYYLNFHPKMLTASEELYFQQQFVQPLTDGILQLPQLLQPGHPAYDQVMHAFEMVKDCGVLKPNYKAFRHAMTVSICAALLPWCSHPEVKHSVVDSNNPVVRQTMVYIRRNYLQPLDLKTIADQAHLHPNYLCDLFKKHTGQTVMYHLHMTRIDTAKFLLENSQMTVTQVAERSGYRNESVFYQKFKKLTGQTPTQYRQAHSAR